MDCQGIAYDLLGDTSETTGIGGISGVLQGACSCHVQHLYGTNLTERQVVELLEYLKTR